MKYISLLLLASLTLYTACQAPGVTPSPNQSPTSTPDFLYPGPTPSGDSPFFDIFKQSNADVTQRESFLNLTQAHLSPDRQQVLYSYQKLDRAQFNHAYRPIAERQQQSGLWLYDHRTQTHREIRKNDGQYETMQSIKESTWWGDQEIVYLDHEKKQLQRLNLQTGQESTLFAGHFIHGFQVKAGYAFVLHYNEALKKWQLTRIQQGSGNTLTVDIPYADFYTSPEGFQAVSADVILLGQFKEEYQRESYPFKVATTSPPSIQDTFLIHMSSAQITPLEKGLDLSWHEQIEMSSDQKYLATQRRNNTQIYTLAGELVWESEGSFSWLSAQDILIQNGRRLSHFRLSNGVAQLQNQRDTQTECTSVQGIMPVLIDCPLGNMGYYDERRTRIFQLDTMQELPAFMPANTDADTLTRSQSLLPADTDQPVRLVEHAAAKVPQQGGYASLSYLDETGAIMPLFQLKYPEANFVFDPKDHAWMLILN